MKTSLEPPLKFQVSLVCGLNIIIVDNDEPDIVNCTMKKDIKFLLQAKKVWNKAKIRCMVISEIDEVYSAAVEKEGNICYSRQVNLFYLNMLFRKH